MKRIGLIGPAVQKQLLLDEPVPQERRTTRFRICPRCGQFIGLTVTQCGWCGKRLRRQKQTKAGN